MLKITQKYLKKKFDELPETITLTEKPHLGNSVNFHQLVPYSPNEKTKSL